MIHHGGVIKTEQSSEVLLYLKQWINIIQMPLYFSIAGYLFYNTMRKNKWKTISELIKNKFVRLLIPFFTFAIIWLLPIRFLIHYENYQWSYFFKYLFEILIGIDSGYLWFLPTLFFTFIIIFFIEKYNDKCNIKRIYILIFLLVISLIARKLPVIFFIRNIATYMVWFYLGFLLNSLQIETKVRIKPYIKAISLLITIVISNIYIINITNNYYINYIFATLLIIEIYECMPNKSNRVINFLDNNSFGLYLIHSPLVYVWFYYFKNGNPYLVSFCTLVIGGIISLGIIYIIRKLHLSNMLGEIKKGIIIENLYLKEKSK